MHATDAPNEFDASTMYSETLEVDGDSYNTKNKVSTFGELNALIRGRDYNNAYVARATRHNVFSFHKVCPHVSNVQGLISTVLRRDSYLGRCSRGGAEIFILYSFTKHMHAESGVNQHVCTCGLPL